MAFGVFLQWNLVVGADIKNSFWVKQREVILVETLLQCATPTYEHENKKFLRIYVQSKVNFPYFENILKFSGRTYNAQRKNAQKMRLF